MSEKILWVTSFNKRLYEHSGKKLIETFIKNNVPGEMFIAHEDKLASTVMSQEYMLGGRSDSTVWLSDLEKSKQLASWLYVNRDIIPKHLGGESTVCKCKGGANPSPGTKHSNPGCHWTWWNRNASRWFRKIPALESAFNLNEGHRYIIWIDCDCYFTEQASEFTWDKIAKGSPGFYMQSPKRKVLEGGIVGYDSGCKVARAVHEEIQLSYESGDFRRHDRWDDSFIVQVALETVRARYLKKKQFVDIASHVTEKSGHVVEYSLIGKYVRHNKGEHARKGLTG